MNDRMDVIGGGPAGAAAAIAASRAGAHVTIFEKSPFPRHKVCGEFLSPEASLVFEKLGIRAAFEALHPFPVRRAHVTLGRTHKTWKLDEPAFGISRFALDHFLLTQAAEAGAVVRQERCDSSSGAPTVVACGRKHIAVGGHRHFGFKAHFSGPLSDSIDLLFNRDMYLGINCIENGATNVCGLASEDLLRSFGFRPDDLLASAPAIRDRLQPLTRTMDWLITGPLVYGGRFQATVDTRESISYSAGDALGFVDPFTGSGMLAAVATGYLAGQSCAHRVSPAAYLRACDEMLGPQYRAAALFRKAVATGWAPRLAWLVPGPALFHLTRPSVEDVLTNKNPASTRRIALAGPTMQL